MYVLYLLIAWPYFFHFSNSALRRSSKVETTVAEVALAKININQFNVDAWHISYYDLIREPVTIFMYFVGKPTALKGTVQIVDGNQLPIIYHNGSLKGKISRSGEVILTVTIPKENYTFDLEGKWLIDNTGKQYMYGTISERYGWFGFGGTWQAEEAKYVMRKQ